MLHGGLRIRKFLAKVRGTRILRTFDFPPTGPFLKSTHFWISGKPGSGLRILLGGSSRKCPFREIPTPHFKKWALSRNGHFLEMALSASCWRAWPKRRHYEANPFVGATWLRLGWLACLARGLCSKSFREGWLVGGAWGLAC